MNATRLFALTLFKAGKVSAQPLKPGNTFSDTLREAVRARRWW